MKLRCERDTLLDALSAAGRAVSTRSTALPVLAGLQFKAENNELVLTGTDLDLTIQIKTMVTVIEPGSCVIPARLITDIVKAVAPGAVTIETDDDEARITAGRSQFDVRIFQADEFPRVTTIENYTATLSASDLSDALRQVVRAASSDDARPIITGVLLQSQNDALRLVATDSYRLAVRDIAGADVLAADQSVLVPSKALGELTRLLSGAKEVQVALDEREITFAVDEVHLTSRLIEGQFPDYQRIIPTNYTNHLSIDRDVLLEALRRVKLLVKDANTPVRMALRADGIELTVVSQEIGQATEDVEAKYEGENMTVAFNPLYLIDGLEAVASGEVVMEILDGKSAVSLKENLEGDFLYLLMPVRI